MIDGLIHGRLGAGPSQQAGLGAPVIGHHERCQSSRVIDVVVGGHDTIEAAGDMLPDIIVHSPCICRASAIDQRRAPLYDIPSRTPLTGYHQGCVPLINIYMMDLERPRHFCFSVMTR
jgi:hypothetical protein